MKDDKIIKMKEMCFPGDTITWAGEFSRHSPTPYAFGTENGNVMLVSLADQGGSTPWLTVESGEAINGVARANGLIAVSTRSEVVFLGLDSSGSTRELYRYDGGAHGVIATPDGRFVAPLGPHGLLVVGSRDGNIFRTGVVPRGREYYFYKLASLGLYQIDHALLAGACRQGGLIAISLGAGAEGSASGPSAFHSAGLDILDVCSIGTPVQPHAIAGLASDCSIHLSHNLMVDKRPTTLRFSQLAGSAYTIRSAQGHIFVLTSRGLYIMTGLAKRFLEGQRIDGSCVARYLEVDAFDFSITYERDLFLLLPGSVFVADVHSFSTESVVSEVGRELLLDGQSWEAAPSFELEAVEI